MIPHPGCTKTSRGSTCNHSGQVGALKEGPFYAIPRSRTFLGSGYIPPIGDTVVRPATVASFFTLLKIETRWVGLPTGLWSDGTFISGFGLILFYSMG